MSGRNVDPARSRGSCADVRRAIGIVERPPVLHGAPVYVRKETVPNHFIA